MCCIVLNEVTARSRRAFAIVKCIRVLCRVSRLMHVLICVFMGMEGRLNDRVHGRRMIGAFLNVIGTCRYTGANKIISILWKKGVKNLNFSRRHFLISNIWGELGPGNFSKCVRVQPWIYDGRHGLRSCSCFCHTNIYHLRVAPQATEPGIRQPVFSHLLHPPEELSNTPINPDSALFYLRSSASIIAFLKHVISPTAYTYSVVLYICTLQLKKDGADGISYIAKLGRIKILSSL